MTSDSTCPQCGGRLAETTGEPMCPACLMKNVINESESELESRRLADTQSIDPSGWDSMRSVGADKPLPELEPGAEFGDYRIVRRLGSGGMGVVYEAEHQPTSRHVALKILGHALDDRESRARFLREGRLAASINHPNSVYVYGTEEIDGVPTISMEMVPGGTLGDHVKSSGPLSVQLAVDSILQIIDGLAAADERGVLHRDVKPSNCFIDPDGSVKIGDFGLSISTEPQSSQTVTNVTQEGTFLGTPAFASPEQLRGEPLDRRSDIYSVGVTLYHLLTGEVPFAADNMIHLLALVLDKTAPSVRRSREDVPEELAAVISKCLEKSSSGRFESYEALREALLPFGSAAPVAGSLGNRALAGLIDIVVCWLAFLPLNFWTLRDSLTALDAGMLRGWQTVVISFTTTTIVVGYYAIAEWRFGKTIGKHYLGLRVASGKQRPRFGQCLGRALLYVAMPIAPSLFYNIYNVNSTIADTMVGSGLLITMLVGWSYFFLKYGLFITARAGNGYAAIHDRLTGTRILERVSDEVHEAVGQPDQFDQTQSPITIGPYHRLRTLWDEGDQHLILGYDSKLLRRVWIHVQPSGTPAIQPDLRDIARPTRLRWLGGKRTEGECWDCYEAPEGEALFCEDKPRTGLQCVASINSLIRELQCVAGDAVTPNCFQTDMLWITPQGHIKLLPFRAPGADPSIVSAEKSTSVDIEAASTRLVRDAASTFLERLDPVAGAVDLSMSMLDYLRRLSTAESSAQIRRIIDAGVPSLLPVRLTRRLVGLFIVTMVLPVLTCVTMLLGALMYQSQSGRYPEIDRLSDAAFVLMVEQQMASEDRKGKLAAVENYIAGNFAELLQDELKMNSFYATIKVAPPHRNALMRAAQNHSPTEEELAEATVVFEELMEEHADSRANVQPVLNPLDMISYAAINWLYLVWFPALIAAAIARGGLMLRMFNLVYVNRHGRQARRLRVTARMLVAGVPVIAVVVVHFSTMSPFWVGTVINRSVSGIGSAVLIAALLAWTLSVLYRRRNQFASDRVAGTYLIAR